MNDPSAMFQGMSEEERAAALAQLAGLSGLEGRSALVQEQLDRAQALASKPAENNGPGWGGVLNGMAHIFGKIRNYADRQQLGGEKEQLAKQTASSRAAGTKLAEQQEPFDLSGYLGAEDEATAEQRALALAQGLTRQRQTASALTASGDKTLGGLGQTLIQDVGQRQHQLSEASQHRLQLAMAAKAAKDKAESDGKGKLSEIAEGLRKEVMGNQVTKATQDLAAAHAKMQSAFKTPSPAGDLSIVFGIMKMYDPASSVRESEQATAENAAGVPSQIRNMWNKLMVGERLSPEARSNFAAQADDLFGAQLDRYDFISKGYGGLAERSGVLPADVVLDLGFKRPAPRSSGKHGGGGGGPVMIIPPGQTKPVPVHPSKAQQAIDAGGTVVGK